MYWLMLLEGAGWHLCGFRAVSCVMGQHIRKAGVGESSDPFLILQYCSFYPENPVSMTFSSPSYLPTSQSCENRKLKLVSHTVALGRHIASATKRQQFPCGFENTYCTAGPENSLVWFGWYRKPFPHPEPCCHHTVHCYRLLLPDNPSQR